jgi:hypothetical protein
LRFNFGDNGNLNINVKKILKEKKVSLDREEFSASPMKPLSVQMKKNYISIHFLKAFSEQFLPALFTTVFAVCFKLGSRS